MKRLEQVIKEFDHFLAAKGYRRTQERFMILEEIYSRSDHFNADELYMTMIKKNFRISRATIYNNLELLNECGLIRKHQFGKNLTQYEKTSGFRQHDHLICIDCHKISEFCDPRLQQIQEMVENVLQFQVTHHELLLFGSCTKEGCENKSDNWQP
jgi:Fur family ferric uptake transcriptional regulator